MEEFKGYIKQEFDFGIMIRNSIIIVLVGTVLMINVNSMFFIIELLLLCMNFFLWIYSIYLHSIDKFNSKHISKQQCDKILKIINQNKDFKLLYIDTRELIISKRILYNNTDQYYELARSSDSLKIHLADYDIINLNNNTLKLLCDYITDSLPPNIKSSARYISGGNLVYRGTIKNGASGLMIDDVRSYVDSDTVIAGYFIYPTY